MPREFDPDEKYSPEGSEWYEQEAQKLKENAEREKAPETEEASPESSLRSAEENSADDQFDYTPEGKEPYTPKRDRRTGKHDSDSGKRTGISRYLPWRGKHSASKKMSKKLKMVLGIGSLGGIILLFSIVLIFLGTLLLPHFTENIMGWRFARTARMFRLSTGEVMGQKTWVDSLSEAEWNSVSATYRALRERTWGKLDQFRPKKMFQNLQAEGRIKYNYEDTFGGFRQRLKSIEIDGNIIEVGDDAKWNQVFKKRGNRIKFAAEVDANLNHSLSGVQTVVRGKVMKRLFNNLGIKLRFWDKYGGKYRNTKQAEADRLALRDTYEKVGSDTEGSASDKIDDGAKDVQEEVKKAVDSDEGADRLRTTGGDLPEGAKGVINNIEASDINPLTSWDSAVAGFSTLYAIADPVCIIYSSSIVASDGVIDSNSEKAQRTFISYATAGDQQKDDDTHAKAVEALNRKLNANGNIGSSVPLQLAAGNVPDESQVANPQAAASGSTTVLNAVLGDNALVQKINDVAIPACEVITDIRTAILAGAAETALAILTGGGSKTVTQAIKEASVQAIKQGAKQLVQKVSVKSMFKRFLFETGAEAGLSLLARAAAVAHAGTPWSGIAMNEDAGNIADLGGNLVANDSNRMMAYGRPLDKQEVLQSNEADFAYRQEQNAERSFTQRYFALSNPDSLASKIGFRFAYSLPLHNFSALLRNSFSGIANVFGFIGKSFANIYPAQRVGAQSDNYTNNIVQWGYSEAEMAKINNDDSYGMLDNELILENSGQREQMEKDFGKCYSDSMGTLLSNGGIVRDEDGHVKPDEGDCAPNKLAQDMVFRWRLSHNYENTLDHLYSIQELTEETSSTVGNGQIVGDIGENSDSVPCATGTKDLGVVTTKYTGELKKGAGPLIIRLCQLSSISGSGNDASGNEISGGATVNSRVSGAWQTLGEKAKSEGIELVARSSFRLANSCGGSGDGTGCAKPGGSLHQTGTAIDFQNMGTKGGSTTSCGPGRQRADGNSGWEWLEKNAEQFGFKQYSHEPWHWDPAPWPNRCGTGQ